MSGLNVLETLLLTKEDEDAVLESKGLVLMFSINVGSFFGWVLLVSVLFAITGFSDLQEQTESSKIIIEIQRIRQIFVSAVAKSC